MSGKANDLNWGTSRDNVDFYDMKGVVEGLMAKLMLNDYKLVHHAVPYLHPGKSCAVEVDGKIIGWFGELHPLAQEAYGLPQEAYILELEIEPLVAAAIAVPKYKHLAKYPSMSRDIAAVVPLEVTNAELEAVIRAHGGELLKDVKVFDIYTGKQVAEGCKSMAFNLTYQAADRTLTDAEVDASMKTVIAKVAEEYKAELRA
jgi:phenylalanyl-tRNA synthetase beta chain